MKAILTCHVPPARTDSKRSWDETCWQKYTLWMHQYRDVIVGSLYGHMNIEHFMFQDSHKADLLEAEEADPTSFAESVSIARRLSVRNVADYLTELREIWSDLPIPPSTIQQSPATNPVQVGDDGLNGFNPWEIVATSRKGKKNKKKRQEFYSKIGGRWGERYSMSHVSASVVPNYFPSLRVFEYNVSGLEGVAPMAGMRAVLLDDQEEDRIAEALAPDVAANSDSAVELERKKKHKKKKPDFIVPDPPSETAPPGPAYSPQTFTFTGFTTYFANLTYINNDFSTTADAPNESALNVSEAEGEWREGARANMSAQGNIPKPNPFTFVEEYNTVTDKTYRLKDLTVKSYLKLARRIGNLKDNQVMTANLDINLIGDKDEDNSADEVSKHKKHKHKKHKHHKHQAGDEVWYTFLRRAFVGAIDEEEIRDRY